MTVESEATATEGPSKRRPLENLLVADFTAMVAGATCTRLLADCGAQVVKVESDGGDYMRFVGPKSDDIGLVFGLYNTGKKSIVVDLKTSHGREVARRLVAKADIVVENFRPGVMSKLGLDYEAVRQINPTVVYCSISGFGQSGPLSDRAAYAPVAHAFSGFDLVLARGSDPNAPPFVNPVMIADVLAGVYAFGAVQTGVIGRLQNGAGCHVDVTMAESMMSLIGIQLQMAQVENLPGGGGGYPPYQTKDGYVNIPLVSATTFKNAYRVLGRSDWTQDPEYASLAGIADHRTEILAELTKWAGERTSDECERLMTEGGVPCATYLMPHEVLKHPQVLARGSLGRVVTGAGEFNVLNPPFTMSGAPWATQSRTPSLGEHTVEVLTSLLGFSQAECEDLAATQAP